MYRKTFLAATLFLPALALAVSDDLQGRSVRFETDPNPPLTLAPGGTSVVFSPGGRYVATYTDIEAKVWECATGKLVYRSTASRYDSQLKWKGSGGISVEFVNETTIVDSKQLLVDLENNIGEPVRDLYGEDSKFYPLDADHGFVLDSKLHTIELRNRTEKVTLWSAWLRDLTRFKKGQSVYYHLETSPLKIDRERGRIFFVWYENGSREDRIVASLNFAGEDYREELRVPMAIEKGYGGYKNRLYPVIKLSPDGTKALTYNAAGPSLPKNVRLVTLGSKSKPIPLPDIPSKQDGYQVNWIGFTQIGDIDFSTQLNGSITTLLLDGTTGKRKDQLAVSESKPIDYRVVNFSPDRKTVALVRIVEGSRGATSIGLYDATTGKHLRSLDDSAQSLAQGQSERELYERSQAIRAAAEAARRRTDDQARAASAAERERAEAEKKAFIARSVPCTACKKKGYYAVLEQKVKYIPMTTYEVKGFFLVYGTPFTQRVITEEKEIRYACPTCQGKGRVAK
ncbi:hypothetical protein [Armatimonas sp.]|uniref:hypothetical protein n=1 Tax=Armatimonas sp. TaxID=1872638 RepID=UPI00286C5C49|nr:hypothetical protein [Armatimonas sp.]